MTSYKPRRCQGCNDRTVIDSDRAVLVGSIVVQQPGTRNRSVFKDAKTPATQPEGRKTFLELGTSMLDARAPLDYGRIDERHRL
jgi:hypothetical protein